MKKGSRKRCGWARVTCAPENYVVYNDGSDGLVLLKDMWYVPLRATLHRVMVPTTRCCWLSIWQMSDAAEMELLVSTISQCYAQIFY
jgi:hypothetical protein